MFLRLTAPFALSYAQFFAASPCRPCAVSALRGAAMSIRLICPGCRKQLAVSDTTAGRLARCADCKTLFHVPKAASSIPPLPEPRPAGGWTAGKISAALMGIIALAVVGFFGARLLLAQRPQQERVAAVHSEGESAPASAPAKPQ